MESYIKKKWSVNTGSLDNFSKIVYIASSIVINDNFLQKFLKAFLYLPILSKLNTSTRFKFVNVLRPTSRAHYLR